MDHLDLSRKLDKIISLLVDMRVVLVVGYIVVLAAIVSHTLAK